MTPAPGPRPGPRSALFLCEGTSDLTLADLVSDLFADSGALLRVTAPDFSRLPERTGHDTESKMRTGLTLLEAVPDVLVVPRDADAAGADRRRTELAEALASLALERPLVPVVPVRTTEAWLLLDVEAIRRVAGNPRGRVPLDLPRPAEVEDVADPKQLLRECLLAAADATGRRRDQVARRFPAQRRQLLERLDRSGPVTGLSSFRSLVDDVGAAVEALTAQAQVRPVRRS